MSTQAYPTYRPSGVEWVGDVPSHWLVSKFRHLFRESPEKIDGDVVGQMLSVSGYRGIEVKGYDDENRRRLDEELQGYRIVRPGQLVVNTMWLNYAGLGVSDYEGHVSPAYRSYWITERLHKKYIHYLMRCERQVKGYTKFLTGIRPNSLQMGRNDLMSFPVLVPPADEQSAIAAFLDRETAKIDALIAEQERLIALLQEKRQAVISQAVTEGLDPTVPMKDSGVAWISSIPAHWNIAALKFLADVQTGLAKGKDYGSAATVSVPYLRVANVQDGYLKLDDIATVEVLPEDVERYRLKVGDVLMNEGGDFDKLGRGDIWHGQINSCIHQNHVFAVRPRRVSSEWLNLIAGAQYAQQFFISRSKQTTNLASISSSNLMELPVILPPTVEQKAILELVQKVRYEFLGLISASEAAISLLRERRAALISAAVTGKIDVREASGVEPAEAA